VLSVVGVGALLLQWPLGLRILRVAGALYLAFIGLRSLRNAIAPRAAAVTGATAAPPPVASTSLLQPYRDGFTINILNPSVTSFYVGVAPTFVPAGAPWTALAFLYAAHISIAFSCHVFWASLFHRARWLFTGERPRRWLDGAIGLILLWLAWRIVGRL
jgi:threonine/homoserine/homoserine lactone efflux protein